MNTIHVFFARLSALLFVLLFCSTAFAGGHKRDVCHVPPDDPDNVHIISISDNASYDKHIDHGDRDVNLEGTCEVEPPVPDCPCFSLQDPPDQELLDLGDLGTPDCQGNDPSSDTSYASFFPDGNFYDACSGAQCSLLGQALACAATIGGFYGEIAIDGPTNDVCRAHINDVCSS